MIAPRVSVIIVSHGRPNHLNGVVKSLLQQRFPSFEIIIVAEPEALSSAQLDVGVIKTVAFSHANISAARNLGIAHTAGEIIAFIDDDARPEPLWLSRLVGPIASGAASAATGRVIGRNGITNQSTCVSVAPNADERTLPFGSKARVFRGECIKLVGTNCAFDAKFLRRLGGFDERYAFYMDDTDVSMRARNDGASIAYVGDAVVHHGFAAGPLRRQDRVPTSLTKIGQSTARFLSSHCGARERGYAVEKQTLLQRNRLIQLMIDGLIDPIQVRLLLKQYQAGIEIETKRTPKAPELDLRRPFRPVSVQIGRDKVLASRFWSRRRVRAVARQSALAGDIVTVIRLSWTALFHTAKYLDDEGYWVQRGGLFGRSERGDPIFRIWRFRGRVEREIKRISSDRFSSIMPDIEPK